ncbi:hypothetical protein QDY71_04615 [Kingella negevensis]|uniref:GAF domain-containing protein n=1 Tax=Kingella negevensis TaxID=1522312 RepID=A0A238HE42_9NEIS|nr:hypothetical protein [Kingella negevensis]MDK4679202.1 hypothetical protein [Kingella negevensis]MDK4683076.1 hypothetical protein [Kingella negevensis]MDK4683736.1 hypothetical protein [Kingella negevensis]MDK4691276.1 hypothetical protein [Kingella negevensis]MDK4693576.1 hypothetical protein [Kingella negevensis]
MNQIKDYLQTQALKLNRDEVAISRAAAQTVLQNGRAHIENRVILHDQLPQEIASQTKALKQLFMALDSTNTRQKAQTAVIYGWQPESNQLIRLAQTGKPIETLIPVNEDNAWQYLAARTVNSGWANIAEDVARWLEIDELKGEHNRRAVSQISLPIAGKDGIVYGVLHIETAQMQPENEIADWVGLALGVLPVLSQLLPQETAEDEA